jgi:serine/threonine protein kinase
VNPGLIGLIGGIVGGIIGVAGGLLGTYFSIKNTNGPRERAFVIKASIACWIFVLTFVFGMCLIPGLYKLFLIPIYVVGLVAGILLGNKKQAQIRLEESKKNPAAPVATATQIIPRKCPQCGAELKPDVSEGLCPACLLQRGIATEGGAPPGTPPFTPPTIPDLAKLFPQLEIFELIGKGGMGAVYKARQPALDRFVALKILAPRAGGDLDFAARFTREARALAKLSHPNIVAVHDFGTVGQASSLSPSKISGGKSETGATSVLHFFIMEYVDGPNLRQIEQAGKLSPREALEIIPQICAALQFAHDEGIVHRDIKPENILLDKKGRVKIADFGLAKILGQEPKDFRLTGVRDVVGTPHYMAPEQVEKPQTVDHRADIYSLGVVFYEMLTGELPLGKFQSPSQRVQVDVRLDEIVMRSLEKDPQRRYQHVSEVKTRVETIAQTSAPQAVSTTLNKTVTGTPLFPPSGGLTFTSRFALNVARTGWVLGCLAALGFIPGLKWMFGFSGFFGFIGFAVLIESVHRLKHHIRFGEPAGRKIAPIIVGGVVLILTVVLVGFFSVKAYLNPGPGETKPATGAVANEPHDAAKAPGPTAPPVIIKTVPESGTAGVDPALTELQVTFSKLMQDGSWSWSAWGEEYYPETTGSAHYLEDGRTCALPVKLKPGRVYAIWLNSGKFHDFKDTDGQPAVPYLLIFETRK